MLAGNKESKLEQETVSYQCHIVDSDKVNVSSQQCVPATTLQQLTTKQDVGAVNDPNLWTDDEIKTVFEDSVPEFWSLEELQSLVKEGAFKKWDVGDNGNVITW